MQTLKQLMNILLRNDFGRVFIVFDEQLNKNERQYSITKLLLKVSVTEYHQRQ